MARRTFAAMAQRDLPIYELEEAIVRALRQQPRLILQAPTGSEKSTQVPQLLLDHGLLGRGEVVILQPRRIAVARMQLTSAALLDLTASVYPRFQLRRGWQLQPGRIINLDQPNARGVVLAAKKGRCKCPREHSR